MVQSIERAFEILDVVVDHDEGIGIMELSKNVGLAPSTVHRLLSTLMKSRYIKQDPLSDRYMLGSRIIEIAGKSLINQNLRTIVLPYLKEIKEKTGETAHLVILDGDMGLCVETVESSANIRSCSPVGGRDPLHCTAVGKVFLAYMPSQILDEYLEHKLDRYTPNTITNPKTLRKQLEDVRANGYAIDDEEFQLGAKCIAVPLFDSENGVIAAIGITGLSIRITAEKVNDFAEIIKNTAERIAANSYAGTHSMIGKRM